VNPNFLIRDKLF